MDARRHPQLDRADGALGAADLLDRPLHVRRGAAGALGVAVAGEEEEQRVAAELEHVAAVALGDADQLVEDRRDAADELFGAGFAVDGEPLGERGEAGDVDRDERAVERPGARAVGLLAPAADQPREIGRERGLRCGLGPGHGCLPSTARLLPRLDFRAAAGEDGTLAASDLAATASGPRGVG